MVHGNKQEDALAQQYAIETKEISSDQHKATPAKGSDYKAAIKAAREEKLRTNELIESLLT